MNKHLDTKLALSSGASDASQHPYVIHGASASDARYCIYRAEISAYGRYTPTEIPVIDAENQINESKGAEAPFKAFSCASSAY